MPIVPDKTHLIQANQLINKIDIIHDNYEIDFINRIKDHLNHNENITVNQEEYLRILFNKY
jgi:hypothetical protein